MGTSRRPEPHLAGFDANEPAALVFNLRMDPFERHDGQKNHDVAMKLGVAWGGQVQDALAAHAATLKEFPQRQKGGTLTPRPQGSPSPD